MDGTVVAAWITAGAALVVAVGGSVRNDLRISGSRRYERRRSALVDAQDAALELRTALAEYGASLRTRTARGNAAGGGFVMSVPEELDVGLLTAEGRFFVAQSRVDDSAVAEALSRWREIARISLIDSRDVEAAAEQRAFDEVNALIGAALRSADAAVPRSGG